jgi:hypothetical protein
VWCALKKPPICSTAQSSTAPRSFRGWKLVQFYDKPQDLSRIFKSYLLQIYTGWGAGEKKFSFSLLCSHFRSHVVPAWVILASKEVTQNTRKKDLKGAERAKREFSFCVFRALCLFPRVLRYFFYVIVRFKKFAVAMR